MEPAPPRPRALGPGAALAAATQVAGAAAAALVAVAIARLLGPEELGAYAVAGSLLLVLATLGTLGLETGIVHLVGSGAWHPRAAWRETQGVALVVGVAGALAGLAVRLAAPEAFDGLSVALVAVVVAALPFALSWRYAVSVALAGDRYGDYALPALVHAGATLAATGALAAAYGLAGAVAGLTAAHVLAALAAALRSRAGLADTRPEPAPGVLRRAAAFGLKTHAANALQLVNYRLDVFVLNAVAAQAAVGRYAVAVSVTSLAWILPRALAAVVFPRVSALSAAAPAERDLVEAKSVRHAGFLALVSAAGVAVALLLVPLVFGRDFDEAVVLGFVLLPGVALLGVANILMATVVGRGRPEQALWIALASTPVTVTLYLVLIPWLEAPGAALASTLSYALSFGLAVVVFRRVAGGPSRRLLFGREELADYRALLRVSASRRRPARSSR